MRHRACYVPKHTQVLRNGVPRAATSEEEDIARREMPRQFERDHAAERRTAEIERLRGVDLECEPNGVTRQRLARIRRRDPADRTNLPHGALRVEKTFVRDSGEGVERQRHSLYFTPFRSSLKCEVLMAVLVVIDSPYDRADKLRFVRARSIAPRRSVMCAVFAVVALTVMVGSV